MPDTTRPFIKLVQPQPNASGFSTTGVIAVQFSERMKSSFMNSSYITVLQDPWTIVSNITYDYTDGINVLTITPSGALAKNTRHSVGISGTIQDYYGNEMGASYIWNFWTGAPSGWVWASGVQYQGEALVKEGYLDVVDTTPANYSSNLGATSVTPILIRLNDKCEIGERNYFADASGSVNPSAFGRAFFETPSQSLRYYIGIENQEVLGDPMVAHTGLTWSASPSGEFIRIDAVGYLTNNEYIVTVKEGLPGLYTNPLPEDYSFVFTTTYSPMYAGVTSVRLAVGPLLSMAMAYIPDDTLRRFIYEASKQVDRITPIPIDSSNVPWYVAEYVSHQSKLNALYAAMFIFASSGAGVSKRLGDLAIEIDARGFMPAILPYLQDLQKRRDDLLGFVMIADEQEPTPTWVIKSESDPRRPITDSSWRRLPMRDVRKQSSTELRDPEETDTSRLPWLYAKDLSGGAFIGMKSRYLIGGRYVTE